MCCLVAVRPRHSFSDYSVTMADANQRTLRDRYQSLTKGLTPVRFVPYPTPGGRTSSGPITRAAHTLRRHSSSRE